MVGVAALAALAGLLRANRPLLHGPDPYWHLDMGRRIVASGLPDGDPYSFLTSGEVWISAQWGTQAIIGLLDRVGGVWFVAFTATVIVALGIATVGRQMWVQVPSLVTVGLLALVMLASMAAWVLRGNLATLVLLPLLIGELLRSRRRPWRILLLLVVWANLHALYLLGVGLLLLDSVGRWIRAPRSERGRVAKHGLVLTAGGLAAGALTPYGPRYVSEMLTLAATGGGSGITEWSATAVTSVQVSPFVLLIFVVLVAAVVTGNADDLPRALMLVAGTLLGFSAQRNVAAAAVIVGVVGVAFVGRLVHGDVGAHTSAVGRLDLLLATLTLVAGVALIIATLPRTSSLAAHAAGVPLRISDGLDQLNRPARVAVPSSIAPAIASLTGNDVRTEVDGRAELFNDAERSDHVALHAGHPEAQTILRRWCVTDVVTPSHSPLHVLLERDDAWSSVIHDPREDWTWLAHEGPATDC